ncbi:hypothetical protein ACFQFC_13050 [Amorphoplanes digitatis]|uniref:CARDB domain-containing protein n=1 Tax=Actinoplanes digitatis TaxID=1868 RepID=A0A7W7I2C2_9ACTN|nr:hypothetical protein [Actinoplanes digitatis]MBB4765130.1 hypothetical protein [Actinoplanes digitatis]BFE74855.1 hypothetical protein GCM10020092_081560 [Actinoplanes digitatis]GID98065.1 hypothetical protein Adi01nite_74770 [Actinoplanes digitatis]
MTNLQHDPLAAAFDEFRGQAAALVKPAGADRTRESVRTRRRNRRVVIGALAALAVAIPPTAEAALSGDPHGPVTGTPVIVPQVSAMPYYVGPGQSTHPSTEAPEGGISEAALYSAELDLPGWPAEKSNARCASGPVRFQDGDTVVDDVNLWIAGVSYADIDRDGRAETFARIFCTIEPHDVMSQVVAFAPATGGKVRTIGAVLGQTGDIVAICGVRAGANGAVQIEIADFPVPWRCADPSSADERYVTRQWLTFAWNGSAFVQRGTAADTTNPYATDLELTSTDLVLTRRANGHYVGSMTLTVRNTGSSAIAYKTQTVISDGMRLVDPPQGCALDPSWTGGGMEDIFCTGAKLAGGATRKVTLKVDSPRRYRIGFVPDTNVLPLDGYNDPNGANDRAELTIEFRD